MKITAHDKGSYIVLFRCEPNIETVYGPYESKESARKDIYKAYGELESTTIKSKELLNGTEVFEVVDEKGVFQCQFHLFETYKMNFDN